MVLLLRVLNGFNIITIHSKGLGFILLFCGPLPLLINQFDLQNNYKICFFSLGY